MAGVTENGFTTKRMGEVIVDLKQTAKPIFQDLVRPGDEVDVGDSSTIGRLIGLVAPSVDDLWQAALQLYQSFDINSATGIALDNLVNLGGVVRQENQRTQADLYLTGRIGTTTDAGLGARSSVTGTVYLLSNNVVYKPDNTQGIGISVRNLKANTQYTLGFRSENPEPYTNIVVATNDFPSNAYIFEEFANKILASHPEFKTEIVDDVLFIKSTADFDLHDFIVSDDLIISHSVEIVQALAEVDGAFEEAPGNINQLATPVWGWEAVTNPLSSIPGRLRETDDELRERFKNARFDRAINIIEALYSAVINVFGVNNVIIYENDTSVVDDKNLPPHSFLVLVDGGSPLEIGRAIWQNRPTGIQSVGNTNVDIVDAFGYTRNIRFSRPVQVPVYIQIKLTTNNNFPANGEQQIKEALIAYVNQLSIQTGIVYSRLYTPINSVPGHQVDSLLIGTDPDNLSTQNIALLFDQVARTSDLQISFI